MQLSELLRTAMAASICFDCQAMDVPSDLFCRDLTTQPQVQHKILVTGATGYIGGMLIPELLARGYRVRAMVRNYSPLLHRRWPDAEIVVADALNFDELTRALEGVDCAYYMIHSLNIGPEFVEIDARAATNFCLAAASNKLKRIIYLGSLGKLGHDEAHLSDHLRSRITVGTILQNGPTPVTFLRAAVIIGSGSTSYRIIKHLINNCPVFVLPSWANSNCQPIAIRDVIRYLVGCLETSATIGKAYDIGGPKAHTYHAMLKMQSEAVGKHRVFIRSGFSSIGLYSRLASLLTPVSLPITRSLMESCAHEVTCENSDILDVIPFRRLTYKEALEKALHSPYQQRSSSAHQTDSALSNPPIRSTGLLTDFWYFMLKKPQIPTLIKFDSAEERQNYSYRILQRLGVAVAGYNILNIHKIGVNAPAKYIFEKLLQWNGDSTCWPNYLAKVSKRGNMLEHLNIHLFGWSRWPSWLAKILSRSEVTPLFELNALHFQHTPGPSDFDNARYLLFKCQGGYPIGVFTMYVRSSIPDQNEKEQAQLFLMVGFNFYGKKRSLRSKFFNRPWEVMHDRVSAHVLNRLKQLSEWRFEKIQKGPDTTKRSRL